MVAKIAFFIFPLFLPLQAFYIADHRPSLRYDRGGVLLTTEAGGTIRVIDLDGADSVTVNIGEEGSDSIMTGAGMTVNGQTLDLSSVKMISHGDGRSWYMATERSGSRWILVLP